MGVYSMIVRGPSGTTISNCSDPYITPFGACFGSTSHQSQTGETVRRSKIHRRKPATAMASVAVAVLLFLQSFLARCHRSQIQLVHKDTAGLTVQDVYYWALELDNNTAAALANLHWESVTDYEEARRSGIVMKRSPFGSICLPAWERES